MRINARANPPTAPQFSLPSQPPSKCLDISTNSNNKAEENSDSENSKSINNAKKKWLNLKTAAGARDETNKSPDTAEWWEKITIFHTNILTEKKVFCGLLSFTMNKEQHTNQLFWQVSVEGIFLHKFNGEKSRDLAWLFLHIV